MKTGDKKHLVQTILSEMAVVMLLDDASLKPPIQKALRGRFTQLTNRQTPGVIKDLYTIKNAITRLTEKLIECEDPAMIAHVMMIVDGINTASVYIAAEGQEIVQSN